MPIEDLLCSAMNSSWKLWDYYKGFSLQEGALIIKTHFSRISLESFAIISCVCVCVRMRVRVWHTFFSEF